MLSSRLLFHRSGRCTIQCFEINAKTMQIIRFRFLNGTNFLNSRSFPNKWFSKASNSVYVKSERLLKNSYEKVGGLFQALDDLLGISDVQEAQTSVKKAESEFMSTRGKVQSSKSKLNSEQERLKDIRRKLDRIPRDDERYLTLATEEHKILLEEKKLKSEHEDLEALERDQFALLSGAVRDSHERERARVERTKHWSVIGSIGGAALGILGSTLVNYIRLKQIKNSIKETGSTLIGKTDELADLVKTQENQIGTQTNDLKESLSTQSKLFEQKLEELAGLFNLLTLNLISDPLKDLGIHVQPAVDPEHFKNVQSLMSQNQGNTEELMKSIVSKIDSVIEVLKIDRYKMKDDLKTLQQHLDNLDSSVVHCENRTVEELERLGKSIHAKPFPLSNSVEPLTRVPEKFAENAQWWSKASTFTSLVCTALTASALLYELFIK